MLMSSKENVSLGVSSSKNSRLDQFRSQMKTKLIIPIAKPSSNESTGAKDAASYFQKYDELEKLGEGSHSVVKKCERKTDTQQKFFSVKIIRTDDIEIAQQARREFEIVKNLNHENILKVEELFVNEQRGMIHLVSQYYEGSITLRSFLDMQPSRCISEGESMKILTQLCSAVRYLHSEGVVHRDLKPSNILIQPETLKIVLIDFGISKIWGKETMMCTPTGTPLYKAPEVIRVDQYDEKVDCWSIGIILFEMIIGQKPFSFSENEEEMIEKMETQSFCRNSRFRKQNQNTQDVIKQLLEPEGQFRISCSEVSRLNIELTPPKRTLNYNSYYSNNQENLQASYKKIEKRLTFSSEKKPFADENCHDSQPANAYLSPPFKVNRIQFGNSFSQPQHSLTPKNNLSHLFNQFQQ